MNKERRRIRRGLKAKAIQRRHSSRPRLVVFRSACHIYAQIIVRGKLGDTVIVSASTIDKEIKKSLKGNGVDRAKAVGQLLGKRAKAHDVDVIDVSFDRAGYKYHGRVKALADGAREAGLNF